MTTDGPSPKRTPSRRANPAGRLEIDLVTKFQINRGHAAPHADILAREFMQYDLHVALWDAERLQIANDRLIECAFWPRAIDLRTP